MICIVLIKENSISPLPPIREFTAITEIIAIQIEVSKPFFVSSYTLSKVET